MGYGQLSAIRHCWSLSIFANLSRSQLAVSPPGPEAEPCSWLHIQTLCSNPEFTAPRIHGSLKTQMALSMALNLLLLFAPLTTTPAFVWVSVLWFHRVPFEVGHKMEGAEEMPILKLDGREEKTDLTSPLSGGVYP